MGVLHRIAGAPLLVQLPSSPLCTGSKSSRNAAAGICTGAVSSRPRQAARDLRSAAVLNAVQPLPFGQCPGCGRVGADLKASSPTYRKLKQWVDPAGFRQPSSSWKQGIPSGQRPQRGAPGAARRHGIAAAKVEEEVQLSSAEDMVGGPRPPAAAPGRGGPVVEPLAAQAEREGEGSGGGPALFGVQLSPDIVAITSVYFVQGILGLSRLAVTFFLKDELKLDPAETALLGGLGAAPWLIKPLYGFISDGLPLFGYRRRSYLVLCGLLGALSWGALALLVHDKAAAVAAIVLSSLSVAVSDVVVDSMVVERARGESQATSGSLQSLCWGSSAAGGIVSAYLSGYLVETYGTRFVFGVTSLLPLATSLVGFLVREEPVHAQGAAPAGALPPAGPPRASLRSLAPMKRERTLAHAPLLCV